MTVLNDRLYLGSAYGFGACMVYEAEANSGQPSSPGNELLFPEPETTPRPIAAGEPDRLEEVRLFPNPARDFIEVQMPTQTYAQYLIFDLEGRVVSFGLINSTNEFIPIDRLPRGTYLLRLKGEGEADKMLRL